MATPTQQHSSLIYDESAFEILELKPTTNVDKIFGAFCKTSQKYHGSETNGSDGEFQKLGKAYIEALQKAKAVIRLLERAEELNAEVEHRLFVFSDTEAMIESITSAIDVEMGRAMHSGDWRSTLFLFTQGKTAQAEAQIAGKLFDEAYAAFKPLSDELEPFLKWLDEEEL